MHEGIWGWQVKQEGGRTEKFKSVFFLILEQVFFTLYEKESWFGTLQLIQNERYRIEEWIGIGWFKFSPRWESFQTPVYCEIVLVYLGCKQC